MARGRDARVVAVGAGVEISIAKFFRLGTPSFLCPRWPLSLLMLWFVGVR